MLTEQLELDFEQAPIDVVRENSQANFLTRNIRLTKAYQVITNFINFPNSRLEQEKLIRIYYHRIYYHDPEYKKNKSHISKNKPPTIPIEEAPDDQIKRVAYRLFMNAHTLLANKTFKEKKIIQKLFLLDRALKKGTDYNYIEALEERIPMQLESFPENSDLIREYNIIIKNPYQ